MRKSVAGGSVVRRTRLGGVSKLWSLNSGEWVPRYDWRGEYVFPVRKHRNKAMVDISGILAENVSQ